MKKLLVVVDMQNDFIDGALGTPEAVQIVSNVKSKIESHKKENASIIFTRDTHQKDYLQTQEGKNLPVEHCIEGTEGHKISTSLDTQGSLIFDKGAFGSLDLANHIASLPETFDEIELVGLCTDICVVSNALILKAAFPETKLTVDASCCAGVTVESHQAALKTMAMCQVNILNA